LNERDGGGGGGGGGDDDARRQLPRQAAHATSRCTQQNKYFFFFTTKTEAEGSLEMLIPMYHTTRRQISDDCNAHSGRFHGLYQLA